MRCGWAADGGDVVCAPGDYCCVQVSPQLGDGGFSVSYACTPANAPESCGASIYCDDPGDGASGTCCWDHVYPNAATCVPSGACGCSMGVPNCYYERMCSPDASACPCKENYVVSDYWTCP